MTKTPTPSYPTDIPTGDPTPPESPADPDLDNTEPCEAFTFVDSPLSTSWTPIPLLLYQQNPHLSCV